MYLTKLAVENVGPFEQLLKLEMPFSENGQPKPIVFVGRNGAGKTTILAHIVDALHEFGANHYNDILPQQGMGHAFFKICGGDNQRAGSQFGFFFLEFKSGENSFRYVDKSGDVTLEQCQEKSGDPLNLPGWKNGESQKLTSDSNLFKDLFQGSTYAYFPAHRFEHPYWLNSENPMIRDQFAVKRRLTGMLDKALVVAHSAESNRSWLLDVILDNQLYQDTSLLNAANEILRGVLERSDVRFGVGPRVGASRTSICSPDGKIIIPSVSNLSGGQASLLNLFLTILRYGDKGKATKLDEIVGIVVIDEIEGHLHTRLQKELLPSLLKLFPRIQFIITSHSPIFLLGMERAWGNAGFIVRELPSGNEISPRDFSEYQSVIEGLDLADVLRKSEMEFVVFVEGQTDKVILETAWKKIFSDRPCPFAVVNGYDCNFIRNTLKRDTVFSESPAKTFIGLLDFDRAFDSWNSGVNERKEKWLIDESATEENGLLAAHPRYKGFLALLPIPAFRMDFAGRRFGGNSCVSIELLFPDNYLTDSVRIDELPGGGKKLEFVANKKSEFAAKTSSFPPEAFGAFIPVFALLEDIVSGKRPARHIAPSSPSQSPEAT